MSNILDSSSLLPPPLSDIAYFNLEVSSCGTTFVLNGNRSGIDLFLNEYGHLPLPPQRISFERWQRRQRIWRSCRVVENESATLDDPSPYRAGSVDQSNFLCPILEIELLSTSSQDTIMAVGYRIKHLVPQLVVNQAGWHRFLALIRHLRDSCVWFYVTRPNTARWNHLPFLLTTPYPGTNSHGELLAIECIRLEPEDWIFLDGRGRLDPLNRPSHPQLSQIEIRGNSAGLLLLAQWIRSFAKSSLESQDILNPWKNGFSTHAYDKQKYPPEDLPLRKFCFRKMFPNSSTPVLAMGVQKAETDCFVFGNPSGLEEWADLIEKSAFRSSYDVFSSAPTQPGYFRNRGDVSIDFTAPEEIYLSCGWDLLEGGFYNPIYNEEAKCFYQPNFKERPLEERKRQFINERICHDHTN